MSGQNNRRWPNGRNQFGVTQEDMADLRRSVEQTVSVCIGCGCDDNRACFDEATGQPCSWIRLDRDAGLGVCSACPDHAERWDQGDREIAVPLEEGATVSASELFNGAIDFALDQAGPEGLLFLRMRREGDWGGIRTEFPGYDIPRALTEPWHFSVE